jgi:hypothetical protein
MRSTGRKLPPRSIDDAARRLGDIEREVDGIFRAFPELQQRSRLVRPPNLPVRQTRPAAGAPRPLRHRVH